MTTMTSKEAHQEFIKLSVDWGRLHCELQSCKTLKDREEAQRKMSKIDARQLELLDKYLKD